MPSDAVALAQECEAGTHLVPPGTTRPPRIWTAILAITCLLSTAASLHEPVRLVHQGKQGQTPLIVLDLRPRTPVQGETHELTAEDVELDEAIGERRWELLFNMAPDSEKALANPATRAIYISALATPPASTLRFWMGDMETIRPSLEMTFQKPEGVERLRLRWDLTDSTGARVRAGYHWLAVVSDSASAYGWLHLTQSH